MDIQITINVPPESAPAVSGATPVAAAASVAEAPAQRPEAESNGPAPWFPAPPEVVDDPVSENGSEFDLAELPPGLEELEFDLGADADDIAPPDISTLGDDAVLGEALPPGLEELGLSASSMSSDSPDLAPPDPSEFETTKKPQRRRKAT